MSTSEFLSAQNLVTLIVVLAIVVGGFLFFLRKRSNRHPMEGRQERNVGAHLDAGREAPDHSPHR